MLVVFRATGQDWATFVETRRAYSPEVGAAGCQRIEAYRNRKHSDELMVIQEWPDKQIFDSFGVRQGPDLDRAAGWLKWKDVSTWEEGVSWHSGQPVTTRKGAAEPGALHC